jgi:hypothetical protein
MHEGYGSQGISAGLQEKGRRAYNRGKIFRILELGKIKGQDPATGADLGYLGISGGTTEAIPGPGRIFFAGFCSFLQFFSGFCTF